jgi:hypothetical protein
MNLRTIFALTSFLLLSQIHADVISTTGTTLVPESEIQIKIKPVDDEDKADDGVLAFVVEYPDKARGGINLKVVEGKWRAVFEKPNKLWIYDGDGSIHLCERTRKPNGFKASSSTKVPALLKQAPKELRDEIPK